MAVFSRNTLNRFVRALTSQGAATEFFNTYNVTTKGTAEASKALVLDSSKGISTITSATITTLTATTANISAFNSAGLATGTGAGFTDGVGAIAKNAVSKTGNIFKVEVLLDLTGTASSTTDLDIIGSGTNPAYIAKLTAAEVGATVLTVSMQCLEAPAGGVTDIDLYSATEGTGKFDDAVSGLTETALITAGGAWTNGTTKAAVTAPLATEYIYLTCGAGGTAATYTAGKFLITFLGY
jgi:hypothetical protein